MDELAEEKRILELIGAGDAAGFDLLVERFAPRLFRYALRMCGDESEAEDALQETFLTVQEKIGQFRGEGRLRNWLYKITGNACLQKHRANKGRRVTELRLDDIMTHEDRITEEPPSWRLDPAEQALSAEMAQRLEQAITQIPETNRQVLILRDVEGLSTRETALALDITEETVKVRLHRARAFVRRLLKDYFEGK
ncbi:MAG TPA: sigma-70 family RNA polymerase sigma factor [bacterium]|nr:sigma-70 family RNA polymerase sigma factor [bacterium]